MRTTRDVDIAPYAPRLAEATPAALLVFNRDCGIEAWNPGADALFELGRRDAAGKSLCELLLPENARATTLQIVAETIRTGGATLLGRPVELEALRPDGTSFPVELTILSLAGGGEPQFGAVFRDLSLQRATEQGIEAVHSMLELLIDSVPDGIFGVDDQGEVTFLNPAGAELVGWEKHQLVGYPLQRIQLRAGDSGQEETWEESPVRTCIREGRPTEHVGSLCRRDGSTFPAQFLISPLREEDRIRGAVVIFRDLSVERRMQSELLEARKLESIGHLAAGIAHEVNTPTQFVGDNLQFLKGAVGELAALLAAYRAAAEAGRGRPEFAETLAAADAARQVSDMDFLLAEIPQAIDQSLEGISRVASIVSAMKEFSHPGSDEMSPTDLNHAIETTVTVARNEWKYVSEVVLDLDPGLPAVPCYPGQINQVVLNLVVNAAHAIEDRVGRASGEKGAITIATRQEGGWAEIRVSDTGKGIPPEIRGRIFDPFFTTKAVGRGTGQGLAVARSAVVDKHGGTISFQSEMGEGTTFLIRLPLARGEE